jgi:demethoxyubiquinone hydroxylase (CLK1/Coq7/Cat5 family)
MTSWVTAVQLAEPSAAGLADAVPEAVATMRAAENTAAHTAGERLRDKGDRPAVSRLLFITPSFVVGAHGGTACEPRADCCTGDTGAADERVRSAGLLAM